MESARDVNPHPALLFYLISIISSVANARSIIWSISSCRRISDLRIRSTLGLVTGCFATKVVQQSSYGRIQKLHFNSFSGRYLKILKSGQDRRQERSGAEIWKRFKSFCFLQKRNSRIWKNLDNCWDGWICGNIVEWAFKTLYSYSFHIYQLTGRLSYL